MKFAITTTPLGNLPPEMAEPLFQAAKAWLADRKNDGTIDVTHGFPEGGGLSIANAGSHEELMNTIRGFPLFPFIRWDIRPLVDINESMDSAIAMFRQMAAQRS